MATSTYHGSCHCGAVAYSVELDLEGPSIVCNCSMCGRSGAVLSFVTPDKFSLERGQDNLTEYKFNKHVIHHVFCKTCGVRSFAHGTSTNGPMIAINRRCLEGLDPFEQAARAKQVDGRSV